ncbi:MAG: hypothetical protein CMO34_07295 [Verrucomicrobia bacterium]|nr:hypothetical protein [Verrucomicrobiota bacterium]|tara:strand:- start:515 stop:904 length:390 start_codon:yes stop_codon:yes gene_type:complete
MKKIVSLVSLCLLLGLGCSYENEEEYFDEINLSTANPSDTTKGDGVTFQFNVNPIIQTNCTFSSCHRAGAPAFIGDYTKYSGIKDKVDNGSFKRRVIDQPRDMPRNRPPLQESQIDQLKAWINDGAPNN